MKRRSWVSICLLPLIVLVDSNELSRCCAGGSRHYREARTCLDLKSEGVSTSCRRAASICCLRASLEKSCELGAEMGRTQGYCSATVNILGGGLRKECCDCCLLGKELRENDEKCEAPAGFSAYCLRSFNECCNQDVAANSRQNLQGNAVAAAATNSPTTDRCRTAGCDHFCNDRDSGVECSCRAGYDLGPDGKTCIAVRSFDSCIDGRSRCPVSGSRCVSMPNGYYRCDPDPLLREVRPTPIPRPYWERRNDSTTRDSNRSFQRPTARPSRTCTRGFQFSPPLRRCVDVDECFGDPICLEPNTQCLNTEGTYQCVCKMGFYWSSAGYVCVDIDECLLLVDDCLESQRCLNTPGSYKCIRTLSCGTGYALDSETEQCVDVDECNLGAHDCGPLYHCRNTQGSYRCDPKQCGTAEVMDQNTGECTSVSCPTGYVARDGRCEDVDECQTPHKCGNYEECINTPGSFRCQEKGNLCAPGYRMDQESGFCLDLDECQTNSHTCGQLQCINLPGTFKCRCSAGYEFNETSKLCEDVDECIKFRGHICSQHATCENTIGSFNCKCRSGYQLGADGRHCDDVDECSTGESRCQEQYSSCINTPGSYQCVCERGYRLGANELTCEDIDECATWARTGNQLCMGECVNTPGAFKCTCPVGYVLLDDNVTCKDVDECGEIGCPRVDDLCVNTLGSFRCQQITCPKNYVLDKHYKNRCVRKANLCANPQSERCKRHPVHISWQHIAIPRHVNISTLRTSITLFSMRGPVSPNSTMQFELRLVNASAEAPNVTPAVRENFLIQKGDDRNSAVIALRDSLDGPQTVHLELILRLTTNGEFGGKYVANLNVYVSQHRPAPHHRHLQPSHQHRHFTF